MLKVLLVDDELLVRLALRTAIPWEEHGFQVVAEAEDGITGFRYVQQLHPDIVLTDISMPGMNGIELIKKTKEFRPATEMIILSCHNDFEYVKEGMRAGAADYILKLSMSMEELLKELLQLKEKILKNQIHIDTADTKGDKESWAGLLFSLITQEESASGEMIESGRQCGLLDMGEYVMFAILAVDCEDGEVPNYNQSTMIEHLAEAVMVRYKVGCYIPFDINRGVVLCQMESLKDVDEKTTGLKNMMEELLGLIHDYHGIWASAGISGAGILPMMKTCYRQAYEALSQKFYTGPGKAHLYTKEIRAESESSSDEKLRELMKSVDSYDMEEIRRRADIWINEILVSHYPGLGMVRKIIHELLFKINSDLVTIGEALEIPLVESAYYQIQKQTYLKEMQKTLNAFLKDARYYGENCKDIKREILQAKKYVSQYYAENMKLSDVAEYVNMNVDYFSHLFKKETGIPFTDYLNCFRIEKAKQLLRSGQYKVYEAAFAVGFQDENYFIKRFKKQTGYTPMEFMRL